jgi:hypothetical protein
MAKTLATQRTLQVLRDEGWVCCTVERYMNHPGMKFPRRIDAFGIGDILACHPVNSYIALVQCFPDSGGKAGFDAHLNKIISLPETRAWISSGGRILLYGWKKRKGHWQWHRKEIILS